MADEVNQKAFDGGDTESETAKEIKKRNEAMQTYVDKLTDINKKRDEAIQEAYDAGIAAEKEVADSTQALITGAPVGQPDQQGQEGAGRSEGGKERVARKSSS